MLGVRLAFAVNMQNHCAPGSIFEVVGNVFI